MDGSGVLSSNCKVKSKTVDLSIDTKGIGVKKCVLASLICLLSTDYDLTLDGK